MLAMYRTIKCVLLSNCFSRKSQIFAISIFSLFIHLSVFAQFDGAAGSNNSLAIHKDSSLFINWANSCEITRGLQDISNPSLGYTSVGDSISATQKAGINGVVSLGDGGMAILKFPFPIRNGVGPDFAVFENSFNDSFLELAFVEVSSDGVYFARFPAVSNFQSQTQIGPFDNISDPTTLYNLAGKYRANYGTPFDLEDLINDPNINTNAITHVKIKDVIGSISPLYASYDSGLNIINDPFPTPFASGGFDLDAVGVIHQYNPLHNADFQLGQKNRIYPNPAQNILHITTQNSSIDNIQIINSQGIVIQQVASSPISIQHLLPGVYYLSITTNQQEKFVEKFIKTE